MKKVLLLLSLGLLSSCYHEYVENIEMGEGEERVSVPVYWNKATKCYEMKIDKRYYTIAVSDEHEPGTTKGAEGHTGLRSYQQDSVVIDMWKHTAISNDSTHNHFTRTVPVIDDKIDVSLFVDYNSCVNDRVSLYHYRELAEGCSFTTKDEFPDDPNALTIYNYITIQPK